MVEPAAKKAVARFLEEKHQFSERRACRLLKLSRTAKRHQSKRFDDPEFIERLKDLAGRRVKWGYRQLMRTMKRDEGLKMGFREVVAGPLVRSSYHADHAADVVTATGRGNGHG